MTTFKLSTYPKLVGHSPRQIDPFTTVVNVPYGEPADITFQRYTKGYETLNERPFKLVKSKRQFKTLAAAVKALKKELQIG